MFNYKNRVLACFQTRPFAPPCRQADQRPHELRAQGRVGGVQEAQAAHRGAEDAGCVRGQQGNPKGGAGLAQEKELFRKVRVCFLHKCYVFLGVRTDRDIILEIV